MKAKQMIKELQKLKPNDEVHISDDFSSGDEGYFEITGIDKGTIRIAFKQTDGDDNDDLE